MDADSHESTSVHSRLIEAVFSGTVSSDLTWDRVSRLIKLVPTVEKFNLDFNRYINVHASAAPQTKRMCGRQWGNKTSIRLAGSEASALRTLSQ
jgi:hypothetical protein